MPAISFSYFRFIFLFLLAPYSLAAVQIDFSDDSWKQYISDTSHLADSWQKNSDGTDSIVPGALHQQYGKSSFKVSWQDKDITSPIVKIKFNQSVSNNCNLYIFHNNRAITLSPFDFEYDYSSVSIKFQLLPESKEFELGILPTVADQELCNDSIIEVIITSGTLNDDLDGDSIPNSEDICPLVRNTSQEDTNRDGIGDSCEFNRTIANEREIPTQCITVSDLDNDQDKIVDICDLDDDNDGLTDRTELQLGLDIFSPYNPLTDGLNDYDNDGLSLNEEILYDLDPLVSDRDRIIFAEKFLWGHPTGIWTIDNHASPFNYIKYESYPDKSFVHRSYRAENHYQFDKDSNLTLKGTSFIIDNDRFINATFSPHIKLLPAKAISKYEYTILSSHTVHVETETTTFTEQVVATGYVKTQYYRHNDSITFEQSVDILGTNSVDPSFSQFAGSEVTLWSESKGLALDFDFYEPDYDPNIHGPLDYEPKDAKTQESAGHFTPVFLVFLFLATTLTRRRSLLFI